LQAKLGVVSDEVLKAGTALAGGVASRGETCGALTGAILGVGCVAGRQRLEDGEQMKSAMRSANQVYLRFQDQVGHTICQEIHKILYGRAFRLWIPEELQALHEAAGQSREGCAGVCGKAARIAAEIILDLQNAS
jgi:C_GCAxxG_C_C family probable redox protein